jgi:hypothetical protein
MRKPLRQINHLNALLEFLWFKGAGKIVPLPCYGITTTRGSDSNTAAISWSLFIL